jgi:hypothetical protein
MTFKEILGMANLSILDAGNRAKEADEANGMSLSDKVKSFNLVNERISSRYKFL